MMATAMEITKQGRGTGTMDGIRQNRGLLVVFRAGRKGLSEKVTCE